MNKNRIGREELLFEVASSFAKRSTCERGQVGCVIVSYGRIIATGYNGPLGGDKHCNEEKCDLLITCDHSIHAEANAIYFSARNGIALYGTELYCTHGPCKKCAEAIIQAGIGKVWYLKPYKDNRGVELLVQNGVTVIGIEEE